MKSSEIFKSKGKQQQRKYKKNKKLGGGANEQHPVLASLIYEETIPTLIIQRLLIHEDIVIIAMVRKLLIHEGVIGKFVIRPHAVSLPPALVLSSSFPSLLFPACSVQSAKLFPLPFAFCEFFSLASYVCTTKVSIRCT